MSARSCHGFTLLEILVALAVLATAMFAIIKTSTENASNTAYIRDKSIAQWTAMNLLAELQIQQTWPVTGAANGQEKMADRDWYWNSQVTQTSDEDVRMVEISVQHKADGTPLVTLTGYLAKP